MNNFLADEKKEQSSDNEVNNILQSGVLIYLKYYNVDYML